MLWLPIRLGLFFLFLSLSQLLSAQEFKDSTLIIREDKTIKPAGTFQLAPLDLFPKQTVDPPMYTLPKLKSVPDFSLKGEMYLPYYIHPSLPFRGDYQTSGMLKQFSRGAVFGSGGQTSLPGIGRFNEASLNYFLPLNDKLSLELGIDAMKINMTRFAGQTFSTSGALIYRPSDHVAFKAFGSYDIGNSYGMSTHRYGATVAFDMSERFSMEVGAQRYYNAMRGRWETVPIVIPYYRFKKMTLGLDVGGLIYEILRETIFDKRGGGGGPTVAPPRMDIPIR